MDSDKNTSETNDGQAPKDEQQAPADALSRTPDDLEQEQTTRTEDIPADELSAKKKMSPVKRFFHKVNVYFLGFGLLVAIGGVYSVVNYLNTTKGTPASNVSSQKLTAESLKQLANTDASVGNTSQTLTIQGNAIIAGHTLMRGNLNVAGDFQTGGSIQGPSLTISGESNLGKTQINNLQVATDTAVQGNTTLQDLSVAGTTTLNGAVTASQLTVTKLILSGSGTLQLPNHLSFTGTPPGRSFIGAGILGSGGSASVNGSDTSGSINLSSGNHPSGAGCIVKVSFRQPFPKTPRVIVSPVGSAAGSMNYYVDRDTSSFSLCTNNPPTANRSFAFDYFVAG